MSEKHDALVKEMETYILESNRFENDGIMKASTGARNALSRISKLCLERRKEILEEAKERKATKEN